MREWVTHLGGRARGGGFAEITREGGASGEFDGLRRRGNDGYIFFSSVVPLEGRDRLARRTRADPDRSTIIHRDRSIVDRDEGVDRVASHRVVSIDARDDENEARRRARR